MPPLKVIGTETLCLLLTARAPVQRVPAQPWALSDALSHVARNVDKAGPLGQPTRIVRQRSSNADEIVRRATRHLVAMGSLVPRGTGWHAGYEVPPEARDSAIRLFQALSPADQDALDTGVQRLVAMVTIWSKNPRADEPPRSVTV
jgi:hypothetical protein